MPGRGGGPGRENRVLRGSISRMRLSPSSRQSSRTKSPTVGPVSPSSRRASAARRARPAPLSQTISKQPRRTAVMRAGIPRASCGRSVRRNPYCSIFKCCSLRIKYRFQMFGRSGLSFPSGLSSPRRKNPAETEPFSLSPRDCPGVPLRAIRAQKRTRQTCPALRSLLRDSIHERWRKRRKSAGRSPRSRSVPGYSVLVESHLINCRHQALLPVCSDQTEGFADIISHFAQKCKGEFFPRRTAAGKTPAKSPPGRGQVCNRHAVLDGGAPGARRLRLEPRGTLPRRGPAGHLTKEAPDNVRGLFTRYR